MIRCGVILWVVIWAVGIHAEPLAQIPVSRYTFATDRLETTGAGPRDGEIDLIERLVQCVNKASNEVGDNGDDTAYVRTLQRTITEALVDSLPQGIEFPPTDPLPITNEYIKNLNTQLRTQASVSTFIYGGEEPPTGRYNSVVGILDAEGEICCSGSLVTSDAVLTAAHCRDQCGAAAVVDTAEGRAEFAVIASIRSDRFEVIESNCRFKDDMRLLRLSESVRGVQPSNLLDRPEWLDSAASVSLVGYGYTNLQGTSGNGQKMHLPELTILSARCDSRDDQIAFKCMNEELVVGSVVSGSVVGGPCKHDSGGPAFIMRAENEYQVGIITRWAGSCTVTHCRRAAVCVLLTPERIRWIRETAALTTDEFIALARSEHP